ncbi:hypothetical protein SmJEL517_g00483 [Synchytrium microbalum]|uniref:Uncharacterized protein n=1 Tax=Synchytrium microbalum TaxID=1806994 RepID=A0A507C9H4_9FUNG|nr:uncharacterized protein SmJEL517_g00483 [Synchytrium microbalum]TPX37727.1 hypothetical protein SmJEL517_g00483 [Synchytrium microbalum]
MLGLKYSITTVAVAFLLTVTLTYGQDCQLIIPQNALTSAGLSTPYQLKGTNCIQTVAVSSAFVEAAIYDPNNSTYPIVAYSPLVITQGTTPAAAPVPITLPVGAIVALWFGFNGDTLTLVDSNGGADLSAAKCVNGLAGSVFGQFSACNAEAFFAATLSKNLVPALGNIQNGANVGQPCPTTRSFFVVDQDQSDNVITSYLNVGSKSAQNTVINRANLNGAADPNGSDNGLLVNFMLPALGCTPATVPDLTDPGSMKGALALNELGANQFQASPIALVPLGDPMTLVDGQLSLAKTNLYRVQVGQPQAATAADADTTSYCTNLKNVGAKFIIDNKAIFQGASPDTAVSTTLFGFLSNRLVESWANLNCPTYTGLAAPISLVMDANNLVTDASLVSDTKLIASPVKGSSVSTPSARRVGRLRPLATNSRNPRASPTCSEAIQISRVRASPTARSSHTENGWRPSQTHNATIPSHTDVTAKASQIINAIKQAETNNTAKASQIINAIKHAITDNTARASHSAAVQNNANAATPSKAVTHQFWAKYTGAAKRNQSSAP